MVDMTKIAGGESADFYHIHDKVDTQPHQQSPNVFGSSDQSTFVRGAAAEGTSSIAQAAQVDSGVRAKIDTLVASIAAKMTDGLVKDDKNAVFSAPGLAILMLLAANGTSVGEQRNAYLKALGLQGLTMSQINHAAKDLTDRLAGPGSGIEVRTANLAVSASNKSGGFTQGFRDGASMGVPTSVIDEAVSTKEQAEHLASRINAWTHKETNEMIDKIVTPSVVANLIWGLFSAITFEGVWTNPFVDAKELLDDPKLEEKLQAKSEEGNASEEAYTLAQSIANYIGLDTWSILDGQISFSEVRERLEQTYEENSVFTLGDGTTVEQNMMHLRQGGLKFVEGEDYTGVCLPYGAQENGAYMVAMLPKGEMTPKQLLEQVGTEALEESLANADYRSHDADDTVWMPRFKTAFSPENSDVLKTLKDIAPLGFNGLVNDPVAVNITAVLKAAIDVGPRKVKAAQVAGMIGLESLSFPPPPKTLRFDKPFAYAIMTADGGTPIFQGVFNGEQPE